MPTYNGRELDSTDYRDEDTLRWLYWDEELSLTDIADVFSVSKDTVWKWMKDNGIERRTAWEANKFSHAPCTQGPDGYVYWYSKHRNEQKNLSVHRLLAVSECGFESVVNKHVHHKNGIPWDNRPSNIEVMEPTAHHQIHSTGSENPNSTLTESDVREIKHRLETRDVSQTQLAREYGVQKSAINKINTGRKWSHITTTD